MGGAESNSYSPFNDAFGQSPFHQESREGQRRRGASPAVIFQAFFSNPDTNGPVRGISITREVIGGPRGRSPDNFSQASFFQTFGIFNHLFQDLVGDIFNQELFMNNFNSNFRSSDIFQDIITQSMNAAQNNAKKPVSKEARKKLASGKFCH